jgi:hypothetical protein
VVSIPRRVSDLVRGVPARTRAGIAHLREELATRAGRQRLLLAWVGPLAVLLLTGYALSPIFEHIDRYGIHDWDTHIAYRHITTLSLLEYGEAPLWTPYFCGGSTSWGYVEGSTNFVSPYLLFYLLTPVRIAIRLELVCSTLVLASGVYLLAGRFTRSPSLRILAVAIGAMNGRWALQTAAGHTWHVQYAWLPLALYLFDVAIVDGKRWYALWCGVVLAEMLYMGGIYPLPHAALILGFYALLHVLLRRTLRPIVALAIAGTSALGLAAPKLLPLLATMRDTPRLVPSTEQLSLGQLLTMFVSRHNDLLKPEPVPVPEWPWHEYGIYIGWAGVALLLVAVVVGRDTRTYIMKITALALLTLGAGAFHAESPWALLHKLPVFSSQHVPTRFLYPGVMLLAVALAAGLDGWSRRLRTQFGAWIEIALLVPVLLVAYDIEHTGRPLVVRTFLKVAPPLSFGATFEHSQKSPWIYTDKEFPEQGPNMLLPMMANVGVINCYGIPPVRFSGAIAKGDPRYRGETYVVGGTGVTRMVSWSPNKAVVDYWNLEPGAALVYNMNYDEGWRANGEPAEPVQMAVGVHPPAGDGRVVFRYVPRGLEAGLAIFGVTAAVIGFVVYVDRRRRRRRERDEGAP